MRHLFVTIVFILIVAIIESKHARKTSTNLLADYAHSKKINDNYYLYWSIDDEDGEIDIAIKVFNTSFI